MSTDTTLSVLSKSLEDTLKIGEKIGSKLKGGEVIELIGDVGSGKTALVRGLAKGAKSDDTVASPSFTISRIYGSRDFDIYHYDFYRLNDAGIIRAELSEASNDPKAVVVVEWSEIIKDVLPMERIEIKISTIDENTRNFDIKIANNLKYIGEDL